MDILACMIPNQSIVVYFYLFLNMVFFMVLTLSATSRPAPILVFRALLIIERNLQSCWYWPSVWWRWGFSQEVSA